MNGNKNVSKVNNKMESYFHGLDVLGAAVNPASDYAPGQYGPLSPDQLAQLDRALTPAEQKAVNEWQSKESDRMLVEERKKGGPQSRTVSVTEKGAVIQSLAKPGSGIPKWQIALAALGVLAIGVGLYKVSSD